MAIGLSTYSFFWQISERVSNPLSLEKMLEESAALGGKVFQICDYQKIEMMTDSQLEQIRKYAESLSVKLELGTKGLEYERLNKYLILCQKLDVNFLRTMFNSATFKPTLSEAKSSILNIFEKFTEKKITIGLETYEQSSTDDLLDVIKTIDSPYLGVCLDPANCVARLENPKDVIDKTADYVVNLHVKDFSFTRKDGWVGFTLAGEQLGEGLLDYDYMVERVKPNERNINQIIEHWLPWQGNEIETCRLEQLWTANNIKFLLKK